MNRPAQLLLRTGPYLVALAVLALLRQSGLAQTVDLALRPDHQSPGGPFRPGQSDHPDRY